MTQLLVASLFLVVSQELLVASLLLVAMPFATSSVLVTSEHDHLQLLAKVPPKSRKDTRTKQGLPAFMALRKAMALFLGWSEWSKILHDTNCHLPATSIETGN